MSRPASPYRAAIIGTGRIASLLERDPLRTKPHTHAGWYAADPRTTLVAGCDVDAARLSEFGADWSIERIGNDAWEVLAPAESPRYSGYRELAVVEPAAYMTAEDQAQGSVLGSLLTAIDTGVASPLSVDAAARALALGVAVMQAGLTGQTVTPHTLDRSLRIASI